MFGYRGAWARGSASGSGYTGYEAVECCPTKLAVDLDVDVIACDIVKVEPMHHRDLNGTRSAKQAEVVFSLADSVADGGAADTGGIVTRRTIACLEEQLLKVTMDVKYRVSVKRCTVMDVGQLVVTCDLPVRVSADRR